MSLNLDPNSSPFGPIQGPSFISPPTGGDHDTHDPTASTISQSLAEALMVQYLMGWPVLKQPEDPSSYQTTLQGITAAVGAEMGRIGSEIWDKYLDHLAEEKERIAEYLNSPAFRKYVEERTLSGQVNTELNTNINLKNPIMDAVDFNQYLNTRINAALNLWSGTIDSVSSYIQQNKESNPEASLFVAASFAITSTYIGDYLNIVDVASTSMVSVNPIQESVAQILPLVPQQMQEQVALTINLLAIGLINFANAESVVSGVQQNRAPLNWETATALARNILANVEGNVVNGLLMAMLINKMENLGGTQEERKAMLAQLTDLAKAVMIAVGVGALLKAAMPDIKLTSDMLISTLTQPLVAQSELDQRLVDALSPLASYFSYLRESGSISEEGWNDILSRLGAFFEANPNFDEVFGQTNLMGGLVQNLFTSEFEG